MKEKPGRMEPADTDEIRLRGMHFHVCVGVLPHERELPQSIEIDVSIWKPAAGSLVDYRDVYATVSRIVTSSGHALLEDLGAAIAADILRPPVRRVRVAIRKPHVALPGPLEFAEVVVTRTRDA